MSFRFQRFTTVYPQFAEQFWRDNPHARASYAELYERFVATRFAQCNYHARHLNRLGHAAENHFASLQPLQKKWAQEHGVPFSEPDWFADIVIAQVAAFQPDVVYLDDLYAFDPTLRSRMREVCRRPPLLVGWRNTPTSDFAEFIDLDLMLTSVSALIPPFRRAGVHAELLHHGFEAATLNDFDPPPARDIAVSFAGAFHKIHRTRMELVELLLKKTPLQVWGVDSKPRLKDRLRYAMSKIGLPPAFGAKIRMLPRRYRGRVHGAVFGRAYFEILARSKIVVNCHEPWSNRDASNMRLFEATGMGACLVTDERPNLPELFQPDVEVVTFRTLDECAERVRRLLDDEPRRASVAAAGRRRTLAEHTFDRRVETLANLLQQKLRARAA